MRVSEDVMLASIVLDAVVRWGEPFRRDDIMASVEFSRRFTIEADGFVFSMAARDDGEIPHVVDVARDGRHFATADDLAHIEAVASARRLATFADRVHLPVIDGGR